MKNFNNNNRPNNNSSNNNSPSNNSSHNNISNKTLVVLLLLALGITLLGTIMGMLKLNQFGLAYNLLTGAATDTSAIGEVNLTINSVTALTNQQALINFGVGRVNSTCRACQADSNNTQIAGGGTTVNFFSNGSNFSGIDLGNQCCVNFSVVTTGFLLENTGNTNVSVGYTCTKNCSHATLIGGSREFSPSGVVLHTGFSPLMIKVSANSVDRQSGDSTGVIDANTACRGGGTLYRDSGVNITNTTSYTNATSPAVAVDGGNLTIGTHGWPSDFYAGLSDRGHWLCGNFTNSPLMPDNDQDALVIDVNITIFDDSPATSLRSSLLLTFNGTSQ